MPSIVIPANNEESYLGACLDALAQQDFEGVAEVIVSANACTDGTVVVAESRRARLFDRGWDLVVLDRAEPGKLPALNAADAVSRHGVRIYLDADVICSPRLVAELVEALDTEAPRYASGTLILAPARSWVTRQFGRTWQNLPFMCTNVPGAGVFAVNAAGRARWAAFPDVIADDAYVRLLFAPAERERVSATYSWPLAEGFCNLVRVRLGV
jgi:glycosyltransferase involved in cell wall biosynthesis